MLINELNKHVNPNNSKLVKYLCKIIDRYNIKNIDDLKKYEDESFSINGRTLTIKERIERATNSVIKAFSDYDNVEDDVADEIHELKQSLFDDISEEEKIYNIIRLFDITGRECYFPSHAYNLIIQDKYL